MSKQIYTLILAVIISFGLSAGCTRPNDAYIPIIIDQEDLAKAQPQPLLDMKPQDSNDLGHTTIADMLSYTDMAMVDGFNSGTDMIQGSSDLAQTCPAGNVMCSSVCVNTTSNINNCGVCNRVCESGGVCSQSSCVYPHHDTFCSDTNWLDNSASVDPGLPQTAARACGTCCQYYTGASSCDCVQQTSFDSSGNAYEYYFFNQGSTTSFRFFYYDDTGNDRIGKADQLDGRGSTGLNWWKQ